MPDQQPNPAAVWEPENYPSVADEPLGPSELAAKAHWERFLPNRVRQLHAQSPHALDTAIRAAWWRTEYQSLLAQQRDPTLSSLQADAMFRHQWLYLPPEIPTTPDTLLPTTT